MMALTATATPRVRKDIMYQLHMRQPKWFDYLLYLMHSELLIYCCNNRTKRLIICLSYHCVRNLHNLESHVRMSCQIINTAVKVGWYEEVSARYFSDLCCPFVDLSINFLNRFHVQFKSALAISAAFIPQPLIILIMLCSGLCNRLTGWIWSIWYSPRAVVSAVWQKSPN